MVLIGKTQGGKVNVRQENECCKIVAKCSTRQSLAVWSYLLERNQNLAMRELNLKGCATCDQPLSRPSTTNTELAVWGGGRHY